MSKDFLDILYSMVQDSVEMKNKNIKSNLDSKNALVIKADLGRTGRGRSRKDIVIKNDELTETVGLPGFLQPNEHDLMDELVRMDGFSYGDRY